MMRITQSISLSNIQTCSSYRGGPPSGGGKPAVSVSKDWRPVSKSASLALNGGDWETANESGGAERDRTADPLLAKQVLSQLSYSPMVGACGKGGGPG
jgi:hypothetical protein